jgi:hypothetical protein
MRFAQGRQRPCPCPCPSTMVDGLAWSGQPDSAGGKLGRVGKHLSRHTTRKR